MPKPTERAQVRVRSRREQVVEGLLSVKVDAALPLTHRSFAMRIQGDAMIEDGIRPGDVFIAEPSPTVRPGELVVALVDGEPVLRRLAKHGDRLCLIRAHPAGPDPIPVSELVIQGVVHSMVRKMANGE